MLSRIAESLFWLGRFVERAEGISISLQVQHSASLEADLYGFNNWEPILNAVGQLSPFYKVHKEASSDNVIDFLIFSPENPNSILECPDKLFNFIRQRSYLFEGATEITMFRGKGYHFMRAGKYLERADQIARILDVKYHIPLPRVEDVGNPLDIYQWKTLLDSTGAYEAYLQHYNIKITPIQIAELLIFNPQLPRSLLFCMERALQSFRHISTVREKFFANKAEQKMGKLYYQIAYSNADEIFYFGLHEYLTNFINDLIDIGDEINHTYFGYV